MAKARSKKPTKVEIVKSLRTAAKRLNSIIHKEVSKENGVGELEEVAVYQVWCPRERKTVGTPTTDLGHAQFIRNDHNTRTGHNSRIIPD